MKLVYADFNSTTKIFYLCCLVHSSLSLQLYPSWFISGLLVAAAPPTIDSCSIEPRTLGTWGGKEAKPLPQILTDCKLTYSHQGADHAHHITAQSPGFSDLPTALKAIEKKYVTFGSILWVSNDSQDS
jgi:hypothetical protein